MTSAVAKENKTDYQSVIEQVLEQAKKEGATASEVGFGIEKGLSVSVRLGEIETLEYNQDQGLGITVYIGQSKGTSSTSDLSSQALTDAVKAACSIAKYTAADKYSGLADKELMAWEYPDLDLCHPWDVSADQAVELATECEAAARTADKRIVNSEGATLSSHQGLHYYANSHGFVGHYPTSRHSLSCSVIGQDGEIMQRDYWYTTARDCNKLESPTKVGHKAAERTLARLNARKLSTRQSPILFNPDMAAGFIGHFTRAIRGGALYRKTSFLLDSIHTQVFPDWFHLHEQPHLKGALGSAPYDSEGVVTTSRDFVKNGVVESYILDSYSARRLSLQTTGNAGGVHNLTVESSDRTLEDLLKEMGAGLFVTELMGQGVNSVTGDYSRGAAGFWVENGEIQYPVEEITIAGNLKDMFKQIVAVGNDFDLRRNIRTGSILLENMTIAGE